MPMPRKRPFEDPNTYYAYIWRLHSEIIYVGYGKNNRGRPACKASWGGRSMGLLKVLKRFRNLIEVEYFECQSRGQAQQRERELIATHKPQFNTAPGCGGFKGMHSSEGIQRIRDAQLGREHSEEFGEKIRQRMLGNKNLLGHKHTEETKAKIAEQSKGRPLSLLGRKKASERMKIRNLESPPRKGKKCSEEHRRKLSEAARRRSPPSEKTREKLRAAMLARKRNSDGRML